MWAHIARLPCPQVEKLFILLVLISLTDISYMNKSFFSAVVLVLVWLFGY